MKVERFEEVTMDVFNGEEAVKTFSDLFGFEFENVSGCIEGSPMEVKLTEYADEHRRKVPCPQKEWIYYPAKISVGFEPMESDPPMDREGLHSLSFKVSDLDEAMKEMEEKGIHLTRTIQCGGLREAFYGPQGLHGLRVILCEYDTPTAREATLQKAPKKKFSA